MADLPAFMAGVKWEATEAPAVDVAEGIPVATHSGVLEVFGKKLRCYRLSDGRAIVDADDLAGFLGISREPEPKLTRNRVRCCACKDEIESKHHHDFVTCRCGATFVDGGHDYNRVGYGPAGYDDLCEYQSAESAERGEEG